MNLIRYIANWFATDGGGNSFAKYEAGKSYPVTEETSSHVVQGIAEPDVVAAPDVAPIDANAEADAAAAALLAAGPQV